MQWTLCCYNSARVKDEWNPKLHTQKAMEFLVVLWKSKTNKGWRFGLKWIQTRFLEPLRFPCSDNSNPSFKFKNCKFVWCRFSDYRRRRNHFMLNVCLSVEIDEWNERIWELKVSIEQEKSILGTYSCSGGIAIWIRFQKRDHRRFARSFFYYGRR